MTHDLRRKCVRFIQDNAQAIAAAEPQIPTGLSNRAADIWEPLFVIADLAGGRWPELARQAALALTASAEERNPIGALLLDILVLYKINDTDRYFSRDLVAALARSTDRPWAELRKGKPIDEIWLAKQLRPYGIHPRVMRIGEQRTKGYYFEDFREVFKRYISRAEYEALMQELGPAQEGAQASACRNSESKSKLESSQPAPVKSETSIAAGNIGPTAVASACSSTKNEAQAKIRPSAPPIDNPKSPIENSHSGAQALACRNPENQPNLENSQPASTGNGQSPILNSDPVANGQLKIENSAPLEEIKNQNSKIENSVSGRAPAPIENSDSGCAPAPIVNSDGGRAPAPIKIQTSEFENGNGAQASACRNSENGAQATIQPSAPVKSETSIAAGNIGPTPVVESQNSKIKIEQEICLQCSTPLNPVAPGQERTQSHCNGCGTPISAPPGTSVPEKCPHCGEPQPLHGYNAERMFNVCDKCGGRLPELKYGGRTPWMPEPQN